MKAAKVIIEMSADRLLPPMLTSNCPDGEALSLLIDATAYILSEYVPAEGGEVTRKWARNVTGSIGRMMQKSIEQKIAERLETQREESRAAV